MAKKSNKELNDEELELVSLHEKQDILGFSK